MAKKKSTVEDTLGRVFHGQSDDEPKPKVVNVSLADRKAFPDVYKMLDELVDRHHSDLSDAKIAIVWRSGWTENVDGKIVLGQCKKGSDLDRELHVWDFVILLNSEAWNQDLSEPQQLALLDHELCHAAVSKDAEGQVKIDDRGRTVYRVRKHDIEEFKDIVARHGCYKSDLEEFVEAARQDKRQPLLKEKKSATA